MLEHFEKQKEIKKAMTKEEKKQSVASKVQAMDTDVGIFTGSKRTKSD